MNYPKLLSLFLTASCIILSPQHTSAQTASDSKTSDSAASARAAIQLIKNQKTPQLIDSLSLEKYSAALIPALADAIAEQDLVAEIRSSAPADFRFDNQWINLSLKGGTRTLSGKTAVPEADSSRGPAFGSYDLIKADDSKSDSGDSALKLLWNSVSVFESNRFSDIKVTLSWSDNSSAEKRNIKARLTSAYPAALNEGKVVSVRERFQVQEPEWLSSFAMLTIRQYGSNEDLLWYYSPNLLSTRELVGSLRSDNIFDSLISPDDFLLFSAKPELLDVSFDTSFETLLPFVAENPASKPVKNQDTDCTSFSGQISNEDNPFGAVYFAPRKVFVLELKQRDPFAQTGRQKLYVDAATMIPFFKEVYSQQGTLLKSVMGAFSFINVNSAGTEDRQETHLIPSIIIAFGKRSEISVLRTLQGQTCNKIPDDLPRKFFDPSALGSAANSDETQSAVRKTPAPKQQSKQGEK